MENLWVFLHENGVEPTNNHAERMIRYAVLRRKRSLGTQSEKGKGKSSFEVPVDAVSSYFKGQQPDFSWIRAK